MAKENEGERSSRRYVVVPRERRRISSDELMSLVMQLLVLSAHGDKQAVPSSLLASALATRARFVAEALAAEAASVENSPEGDDDGIPF